MSVTAKDLGIDRLNIDTRMALVDEIWQGLFHDMNQSPLSDFQREELNRRLTHHKENPEAGVSLDKVMARVNKKLHG